MQIQCPQCGTEIPVDKINVQNMVAGCPGCNNVFSFDIPKDAPKAKRRKLKAPEKLHVEENANSLKLSFKGILSYEDRAVLPVAGILGVIMSFIFLVLLTEPGVPFVILLMFGGFAAFFLYSLFAQAVNTTSITIDEDYLRIHQGPMPTLRANTKTVETTDIEKLSLMRNEALNASRDLQAYYHIVAELTNGSPLALFRSMPDTYARYIVQQLESYVQGEEVPDIELDTDRLDADVTLDDTTIVNDDDDMMLPLQSTY